MSNLVEKISDIVTARVLAAIGMCDAPAAPCPDAHSPCAGKQVVVTSTTRDIWYGTLVSQATTNGTTCVVLKDARSVYYYSVAPGADKGLGGLATVGPQKDSKIGPVVGKVTVLSAAVVMECCPVSVAAFGGASWGK